MELFAKSPVYVEAGAGTISMACKACAELASQLKTVVWLEFNGTQIRVLPGGSLAAVQDYWSQRSPGDVLAKEGK